MIIVGWIEVPQKIQPYQNPLESVNVIFVKMVFVDRFKLRLSICDHPVLSGDSKL